MPAAKSFRLPDELVDRLAERADAEGRTQTELVSSLLDEGLKTEAFPGIVYRGGPSGRRAGLAQGPDIWEVIDAIRHVEGSGDAKIRAAAEWLGLPEASIRLAVDFYTAHPDEIDERIDANERAAAEARKRAERREALLGGDG